MNIGEAQACARIACGSMLGERYGFVETKLAENLAAAARAGGELVVAVEEGRVTGFAWIEPHGAFATAPYLRLIAVDGAAQGRGIGAALLQEFERRTANVGRDYCLLVSDFNQNAIGFYARHGYRKASSPILRDRALLRYSWSSLAAGAGSEGCLVPRRSAGSAHRTPSCGGLFQRSGDTDRTRRGASFRRIMGKRLAHGAGEGPDDDDPRVRYRIAFQDIHHRGGPSPDYPWQASA